MKQKALRYGGMSETTTMEGAADPSAQRVMQVHLDFWVLDNLAKTIDASLAWDRAESEE